VYEVQTSHLDAWTLRSVFDDKAAALADARSLAGLSRRRGVRVVEAAREPGTGRRRSTRVYESPAPAHDHASAAAPDIPAVAPFFRIALAVVAIVATGIAVGVAFAEARRLAW